MRIAPIDWEKFQHYKDRAPPWIKLHKGLLNNPKWHRLHLASRALAPLLWLLASEAKDGIIDEAVEDVAFRLRCTSEELADGVKDLIEQGFFVNLESSASTVLAPRPRPAAPETEGETEKRERQSTAKAPAPGKPAADVPNPLNAETWMAYKKAFTARYRTDPVRNSQVNAQVKQFVLRLGAEAPAVAAFYVRCEKPFYKQVNHAVSAMVRDAESLRTEWATSKPNLEKSHEPRPAVEAA